MKGDKNPTSMRVLLWHWGRRGGGPRYTLELAQELRKQPGLEVYLSLSRQSELFNASHALDLPGFHVDTYRGIASAVLSSLRLPALRSRFTRYLRESRIDVALCTMHHLWNPAFVREIRRPDIPFVTTVHDALLHPGEENRFRSWLLASEIRASAAVITLSEHVREQVCKTYGYPEGQIWVAPHGVFVFSEQEVAPRTFPRDRPVRLLFLGRLLPYKGLDLLLDAYHCLKDRYALELYVVGAGDAEPYRERMSGKDKIHLDNRWIPEKEIGVVLAQGDLVVLPYREASQSGVVPSAYGAGLPVVVIPVGGLTEQVRHLETGVVAKGVSAGALAEAIERLIADPSLYNHCAEGALRFGQERLAWSVIAARIAEILHKVVGDRGR